MSLSNKIISWYGEHRRDLPWRNTRDPYRIWLSEIILQQTRIEQGKDYYLRFCREYPTVHQLAMASEDQVLKSWQGLGYYSRARNLHTAAKYIEEELHGIFPDTYDGVLKLKGVGRYTAAAIVSFAYRLPYPVIDGNVYRLISRLYGIFTPIGNDVAYKEFDALLRKLMDANRPDLFNQAMMDFGSTYCKPTGCDCEHCIFSQECVAYHTGQVSMLPVKYLAPCIKDRYLYYLDIHFQKSSTEGPHTLLEYRFLRQRTEKDIWKGLYEFPLLETAHPIPQPRITETLRQHIAELTDAEPGVVKISDKYVHKLTHRTIHAVFCTAFFDKEVFCRDKKSFAILSEEVKKYPVSRLIDRYLTK